MSTPNTNASTGYRAVRTVNPGRRTIQTDFRILDTERPDRSASEHAPRSEWAALRVLTWHSPERRQYVTRVQRLIVGELGGFLALHDYNDAPESLPVTLKPTARYSARVLETMHGEYIAQHLANPGRMGPALEWVREGVRGL